MQNDKNKKAIIYCRVSSLEQLDGTSLQMQKEACLSYCRKAGMPVERIFVEKGESAKTAQRTEFIKAIDYCKRLRGRGGYFVVWKIDRFRPRRVGSFPRQGRPGQARRLHTLGDRDDR